MRERQESLANQFEWQLNTIGYIYYYYYYLQGKVASAAVKLN